MRPTVRLYRAPGLHRNRLIRRAAVFFPPRLMWIDDVINDNLPTSRAMRASYHCAPSLAPHSTAGHRFLLPGLSRTFRVHPPREKASAERAEWNETDSKFFQCWQHHLFRLSPPQRVFVLDCCDRLNCMCATNRLHSGLRKSEVLHLAFPNQVLYRLRHVFDWHVGIDAVLIKQIDNVGPESLQ